MRYPVHKVLKNSKTSDILLQMNRISSHPPFQCLPIVNDKGLRRILEFNNHNAHAYKSNVFIDFQIAPNQT